MVRCARCSEPLDETHEAVIPFTPSRAMRAAIIPVAPGYVHDEGHVRPRPRHGASVDRDNRSLFV
jgi:hypothetical protein